MQRSKVRIAVTSVGGGVGQSILKALRMVGYTVIAMDADPLAVGLYAAPHAYLIPHSKDKQYIARLLEICQEEGCKILFPGSDTELALLSTNKARFEAIGITVVVSKPEVIALADNKLETYTTLNKAGITVPKTQDFSEFIKKPEISYPVILKPKIGGSRSQNVKIIKNAEEISQVKVTSNFNLENTVVQEFIDSEEFTCGSVTLEGRCVGVIVMRRILRDGDTYKCFSIRDQKIESYVKRVVEHIQPFGACNIQLRLKDGIPYLFEINARCSGTTAARALAGFNEPALIADYLCFSKKPTFKIREISILRYWKEYVVPNKEITQLKKSTKHTKKNARRL